MKVLVIGQGGREHAIIHQLKLSPSVTEIHALPGSDGIAKNALCHSVDWRNFESVLNLCLRLEIDFVMIGPEDPLCEGLSDYLRSRGVLVVGSSQEAAQLEGSKIFAKEFMLAAKIPTASFEIVTSVTETLAAAKKFTPPYVLKADGLAAGKGVFICKDVSELENAAIELFVKQSLGRAGDRALLEQFTPGWEMSYLIFTNGKEFQSLPVAQDHKRLGDQDSGPNTGGMGTIAPLKVPLSLKDKIDQQIVKPTLELMHKRGYVYRGVIFFGLMIQNESPSLLEYNCRFGDPETQVILPLLKNDLGLCLKSLAQGQMTALNFKNMVAACIVMAAPGYPSNPKKDVLVQGNLEAESVSSYFLHAGTRKDSNGQWLTNGGRVLNAIGIGSDKTEALKNAYSHVEKAQWPGMLVRTDIGSKAPIENNIASLV